MSTFSKYPNFINTDPRISRSNLIGPTRIFFQYTITEQFMDSRHDIIFTDYDLSNKTVLDLGCCVGGSGAYVLDKGAKFYCGVEYNKDMTILAENNLASYFDQDRWEIKNTSIEQFLSNNTQKFDVVIASGVIYAFYDPIPFLNSIGNIGDLIYIESQTPVPPGFSVGSSIGTLFEGKEWRHVSENERVLLLETYPFIYYGKVPMIHTTNNQTIVYNGSLPSIKFIINHMAEMSYQNDHIVYDKFREVMNGVNGVFHPFKRFGLRFSKTVDKKTVFDFVNAEEHYEKNLIDWNSKEEKVNTKTAQTLYWHSKGWKFDANIAQTWYWHATRHIPNYEQVIQQCVELARYKYKLNSKIIDVGCSTGVTLKQFKTNGFTNLYGVDSSPDMIAACNTDYNFTLATSDKFPKEFGSFDLVIMNWTLHFVKEKVSYLKEIYDSLNDNGTLILSEKISLDPYTITQYHNYKRSRGVSEEEIKIKEQSVKDIMFIDDIEWYQETLKNLGFTNINIINSSWGFCTFACNKENK